MAVINIAGLNPAGPLSDADLLHISQAGIDYKITLNDLTDHFGLVDIFGLNEEAGIDGADFIAFIDTSVGTGLDANRKVQFNDVASLVQQKQYFTSDNSFDTDDTIVYRKDVGAELRELTISNLRDEFLNFQNFGSKINPLDPLDQFVIYDTVLQQNFHVNRNAMQKSMLDEQAFTANTDVDVADFFYFFDTSNTEARKITYANLLTRLNTDIVGGGDFLSSTVNDTAAGTITFSNATAGIKVQRIDNITGGVPITIQSDLIVQNNVDGVIATFNQFGGGKFTGIGGNTTNAYLDVWDTGGFGVYGIVNALGLLPTQGGVNANPNSVLGTASHPWAFGHIDDLTSEDITATTSASLPQNTQVNGSNLMSGANINNGILNVMSNSLFGIARSASATETERRTFDDTKAISPYSLATAFSGSTGSNKTINSGNPVVVSVNNIGGSGGSQLYRSWGFELSGMLVRCVVIDLGSKWVTYSNVVIRMDEIVSFGYLCK